MKTKFVAADLAEIAQHFRGKAEQVSKEYCAAAQKYDEGKGGVTRERVAVLKAIEAAWDEAACILEQTEIQAKAD